MCEIYEEKIRKARKDHKSDPDILGLLTNIRVSEYDFKDRKKLVNIKKDRAIIKKGSFYLLRKGLFDGAWFEQKVRLDVFDLIQDYELWDEL